jgi:hypothetical protein
LTTSVGFIPYSLILHELVEEFATVSYVQKRDTERERERERERDNN